MAASAPPLTKERRRRPETQRPMADTCSKCNDPGTIYLVCSKCGDRICDECVMDDEMSSKMCARCLDTTHEGRAQRRRSKRFERRY